jgi:hypothetical protein
LLICSSDHEHAAGAGVLKGTELETASTSEIRLRLFLFSVEHPIFTARPAQDWYYGPGGERLHWPIDHYQEEGRRKTNWLTDNVIKYHRTVATYVNTVIETGGVIATRNSIEMNTVGVKPINLTDHLLNRGD